MMAGMIWILGKDGGDAFFNVIVILLGPHIAVQGEGIKRLGLNVVGEFSGDGLVGLDAGGFAFFAARIADKLNFNSFQCNDLNLVDGALDGTVVEPILGRAAKADILTAWAKELGLSEADVLATGDGSNDLAMLGIAGMGVAFRAKPAVAESARYRITHGDLTALLYLQGYRQADFA